ncbi:unnamed protein product, partial [Ilex paraguariensis]
PQLSSTDIPEFLKVAHSSYEEDKAKFEKKIENLLKDKAEFEMKIESLRHSYEKQNAKFEKIEAHQQADFASFDKDKAKLEEKIEALGFAVECIKQELGKFN